MAGARLPAAASLDGRMDLAARKVGLPPRGQRSTDRRRDGAALWPPADEIVVALAERLRRLLDEQEERLAEIVRLVRASERRS